MIISFLILKGFQSTITEKVVSFGGDLQVTRQSLGQVYTENPITNQLDFVQNPEDYPQFSHVQQYAFKPGLLKSKAEVLGVMLKGVSTDYDSARFKANLLKGKFIPLSDTAATTHVVVSQTIADQLIVDIGDDVIMYFVQNPPKFRRLTVSGIYATGMEDFDERIIIGDLNMVRQLNGWADTLAGGIEVFVQDFKQLNTLQEQLYVDTDYKYFVDKVTDRNVQIFDWLSLLDKNVVIILTIILIIVSMNMISILLILIMERTPMIGSFMAMGATNRQIRRIFLSSGMRMVAKGMLFGNGIALTLAALQYYYKLIPLDRANYYMEYVPILWDWQIIIGLNILIFVIVLLVLLVPATIISRIQPIKAIKFD
jgi:lipoprotein-releasing system permease protein